VTSVFATGADERYGYHLLNLLGSLKANSDVFDRIVAYDLGLSAHHRELLHAVRTVEVRQVPPFAPHWSQAFTWKPWIWTHLDAGEIVFWLDAGATILRSLAPALEQVRERGYFVVSQGGALREIVPRDYYELYGLPRERADGPYVAAGIVGFRVGGEFYERVVVPTYEDCLAGRNLDTLPRDCVNFRHDQTLFNLRLATALPDAFVNDLWEYGGFLSPRDHPRQVIWNHRRRGDLRYLARLPYEGRGATRARAFGLVYRVRWWLRSHVNSAARSRPLARSVAASSTSSASRRNASANEPASRGSRSRAASPTTSGIDVTLLATTGVPHAIASSTP
jgi:hypothetical protein